MRRTASGVVGVAIAALALGGCGGAASGPAAAAPPAAPSAPAATPTAPPATSAPAVPPAPASRAFTEADLEGALLTLEDVPTGFSREAEEPGDDTELASSDDASCAALVRLMNATETPGTVARALVGFDGGQDGPFLGESLEAFASGDGPGNLVADYRRAVETCDALTIRIPDVGRTSFAVAAISFPDLGSARFAARFTATGGDLEGLEMTTAIVAVGQVSVELTGLDAYPDEMEEFADVAVGKVSESLGTGTGA